jgi:hypothetical protein
VKKVVFDLKPHQAQSDEQANHEHTYQGLAARRRRVTGRAASRNQGGTPAAPVPRPGEPTGSRPASHIFEAHMHLLATAGSPSPPGDWAYLAVFAAAAAGYIGVLSIPSWDAPRAGAPTAANNRELHAQDVHPRQQTQNRAFCAAQRIQAGGLTCSAYSTGSSLPIRVSQ